MVALCSYGSGWRFCQSDIGLDGFMEDFNFPSFLIDPYDLVMSQVGIAGDKMQNSTAAVFVLKGLSGQHRGEFHPFDIDRAVFGSSSSESVRTNRPQCLSPKLRATLRLVLSAMMKSFFRSSLIKFHVLSGRQTTKTCTKSYLIRLPLIRFVGQERHVTHLPRN